MSTPPLAEHLATRLGRHPLLADSALAAACFLIFTLPLLPTTGGEGPLWAVTGLGLAAVAPLAARRRWPEWTLAAVVVVEVVATLSAVRFTPFVSNAGPAVAIAVFTLAAHRDRRTSLLWSVGGVVLMSVAVVVSFRVHTHQDQDMVQFLLAVPAWLFGDAVRTRRDYRLRLGRQTRENAAEREARIRAEERLRLSRDVHDVVSHTLSMVAVRSGVARLLVQRDPVEAESALGAIETASRTALEELRTVLRETRDTSTLDEPNEPGLADLDRLARTARAAGLVVDLHVDARRYAPTLETTAYRIVQESLTNVVKHAGAGRVVVTVAERSDGRLDGRLGEGPDEGSDELCIEVFDDGRGPRDDDGQGVGLVGMQERAELFDGRVSTERGPNGGFRVVARFPVKETNRE